MFGDIESYLVQFVEDIWDNLRCDKDAEKEWIKSHATKYGINSSDLVEEVNDFLLDCGELKQDTIFSETIQHIIYEKRDTLAQHLMDYIVLEYNNCKWEEFYHKIMG